ncbi:hypothetical protein PHYBOEH_006107 [Phytophthora boehmeriae]|uniref:Uncharacterized protein n=1 Tax=Phytophthora boehmeriae TaxID=109152 RepID=A0A8T1XAA1_9STRA|nr:hypothetical protein PHYBOEH_006107 [Phytophthora boehmeriae]
MSPRLAENWGASLPPLAPKSVEPANLMASRTALRELKAIRTIQVSRCRKDKVRRYKVEVFSRSALTRASTGSWRRSLSPTRDEELSSQRGDGDSQQRPSVRIEKELWEFVDLRDSLFDTVRSAHSGTYCDFCASAMEVLVLGVDPGGMFFRLLGDARVARKLATFMTDFLDRSLLFPTESGTCCSAYSLSLEAVHEFLFTPTLSVIDEPQSALGQSSRSLPDTFNL